MSTYWPSLVIGLVVGTYWARVLKMVVKAKRKTGRGAGFVPQEKLGRVLRVVWYPVVGLWVLLPLMDGLGIGRDVPGLRVVYRNEVVGWVCAAVAVAALAATWACWKRMGKSWRMGIDPSEKTGLIVTGPYAYVRHPIYALSSLLMVATAVAVGSPVMIAAAVVHLLFLQWEARREEAFMLGAHGQAYAGYRKNVGRFLPRSVRPFISGGRNDA